MASTWFGQVHSLGMFPGFGVWVGRSLRLGSQQTRSAQGAFGDAEGEGAPKALVVRSRWSWE